ncbi:hypothetical protein F0L17_14590 [Streptomyces sp. TRM43335]|uniref:Uncharacterized protein n=1 Tax=Streptomyces taklimakanensis TaxID=2569853 RepID=A0A6G2BE26_9ACTN|nr:hypothetical protein [Streptomyces taklimakanensis]MTE20313.1 hypothetical protein [Streptomyces taklimakanensis]
MAHRTEQRHHTGDQPNLDDQLAELWADIESAVYAYATARGIVPLDAADALAYLFDDLR